MIDMIWKIDMIDMIDILLSNGDQTKILINQQRFWQIAEEMEGSERAGLVQFATGSSALPLGGFANLRTVDGSPGRFTIVKGGDPSSLPTASTWFTFFSHPLFKFLLFIL